MSTLTGSSEADVSRLTSQDQNSSHQLTNVSDSISSLISISENSVNSSPLSRRHSITTQQHQQQQQNQELGQFTNRKSLIRRSARSGFIKGPIDPKIRFAQYRQQQLTLKPLFFEVPQQENDQIFIGRQWLYREITNILTTSESQGIIITGNTGTGKTALLLQLVDYSCFGRRKDNYQNWNKVKVPQQQGGTVTPPQMNTNTTTTSDNNGIYSQVNLLNERIRLLSSNVVGYHFCQSDNNTLCLVPDFIHSIAAQLCQSPQLQCYHEYLLNEQYLQNILSVKECIANPDRAFKVGILEPLTILKRIGKIANKNLIILIDGLCEAEYHRPDHGDTITTFLNKMLPFFPNWLKLIVTVRTNMMDYIKIGNFMKISLDNIKVNEALQKDIHDYITFRLNNNQQIKNNINSSSTSSVGSSTTNTSSSNGLMGSSGGCLKDTKFIQYLLSLTNGSFLYVKLILDLIERGNLVIKSTSYKILPISLAEIYLLNFNLRFPTTNSFDKIKNILSICLASLYPLTLEEIFYALNSLETGSDDEIDWNEFLQRFKLLNDFLIKRIDNTYMFFHPSFREWLTKRNELDNRKFLCDLRVGHAAIAFRLTRHSKKLTSDDILELGHHILKAHIYRNTQQLNNQSPRDLQSFWITSSTCATTISSSLATLRNCYSPNIKVSRLLLLAGASSNFNTNFLGNAPLLCIAAHEGILPMVSLLLEFNANVNNTNSQGCTPLILASINGHCDVVRHLISAGCRLGQVDITQRCALVYAARNNKLSIVKYLIACDWLCPLNTNDIKLKDAAQQGMIEAASQGNNEIVEDLLDMPEVYVNDLDVLTGETALTIASTNGCTETVTILMSRGADIDVRNRKEMSALLLSVKEGHWAIVDRLLQNHADLEQTDVNGKTALMVAAEEGHVGIIELLLNRGASITKVDREGLTALSWACLRGRLQAAKCLLERNADKNHSDNTGRTSLDLAAYQGSAALVQMLIENGAKIEHVDVNGMRPLDRAIACRNVQVVQVFLKRGAKLGPATWAMAAGKPEIL